VSALTEQKKARIAAAREFKDATAVRGGGADWHGTGQSSRRFFADGLTEYGREGQCASCGAWRPDGQPPTVHRYQCAFGPDGMQLGPTFDPGALRVKKPLTGKGLQHPPRFRR
jgi:hypothetical protein